LSFCSTQAVKHQSYIQNHTPAPAVSLQAEGEMRIFPALHGLQLQREAATCHARQASPCQLQPPLSSFVPWFVKLERRNAADVVEVSMKWKYCRTDQLSFVRLVTVDQLQRIEPKLTRTLCAPGQGGSIAFDVWVTVGRIELNWFDLTRSNAKRPQESTLICTWRP
jgi:hypothetical protein